GQVGLVRLVPRRRRWILRLPTGGKTAARTIPLRGDLSVQREPRTDVVAVRAPVVHPLTRCRLPPLRLVHHGACPHTGTANGVPASHRSSPPSGPGNQALI